MYFLQAGMAFPILILLILKALLIALPFLIIIFFIILVNKNKSDDISWRDFFKILLKSVRNTFLTIIIIFIVLACQAVVMIRNQPLS